MKTIDAFSYKLGAADCFCEMVRAGVKKIALAHPCDTREERDSFHEEFEKLCQEYHVKQYDEDEGFITDLFPVSMNKNRFNVIFYQDDQVLQEYLGLKAEKEQALKEETYGQKRRDIAWRYGKLLSYTDEGIRRLLEQNQEKE